MIFDQLAINNYGVYKGKQIFDLSTNKKKPIVLIGALNGSGKTTFLNAVDFVLYGKFSNIFQSHMKYVWDNTRWGGMLPIDGTRFYLKYRFAPKHENFNYDFHCLTFDVRDYKNFEVSSFGFRFFGGKYWGDSPYKFKLGGAPWIASSQSRPQYIYDSDEHYFSEYVYPIRGINLGTREGSHVLLMNLEYRLPMLMYYLPAIRWLGQINGVFFTDIGKSSVPINNLLLKKIHSPLLSLSLYP